MWDALSMYQRKGADVVELYSQPRIAQEAAIQKYGGTDLMAGWRLDLSMRDPEANAPWDFSRKSMQDTVRKMVLGSKPFMLVGSPPCTPFSRLQELNFNARSEYRRGGDGSGSSAHEVMFRIVQAPPQQRAFLRARASEYRDIL